MIGDCRDPLKKFFKVLRINNNGTLEETTESSINYNWKIYHFYEEPAMIGSNQVRSKIRLSARLLPLEVDNPQTFSEFFYENFESNINYFYHFSSVQLPTIDEDFFKFSKSSADNYAHYNYQFAEFEDVSFTVNERQMPNFSIGLYKEQANFLRDNAKFFYNYHGDLNMEDYEMLNRNDYYTDQSVNNEFSFDDQTLDYYFNSSSTDSNYFYKFTQLEAIPDSLYSNANKNIFINFDYSDASSRRTANAPYYVKMRIPQVAQFATFPNPNYTSPTIILNNEVNQVFKNKSLRNVMMSSFKEAPKVLRDFTIYSNDALTSQQVQIYDLLDYLQSFNYNVFGDEESLYLRRDSDLFIPETQAQENSFIYSIVSAIDEITTKMTNNIAHLGFEEIIAGNDSCYTETIGYKIEKRGQGGNLVQTYYTLNTNLSIVDTQLVFNKNYSYTVSAITVIAGIKYAYSNPMVIDGTGEARVEFDMIREPSVKVVEVEVGSFVTKIVEPPPLKPEVSFHIERNTKNLLKIYIENSKGNQIDNLMRQQEIDELNLVDLEYKNNLEIMYGGPENLFSSKAFGGRFEIYRMEEMPSFISDFEGNSLASLVTLEDQSGKNYDSVLYTDYIRHNTDYYYLVRAFTHRSNPGVSSAIYKIRLLEDADEIIMRMTTVNLNTEKLVTFENKMRKYLQIIPNKSQAVINTKDLDFSDFPDSSNNIQNLKLSSPVNNDSLWQYHGAKYFKIRLESKKTGKKIDLNVHFKFSKPT